MLIYLHLLILFIEILANKHLSFIYSNLVLWVHPFNWNPTCLALTWPISSLQSPNYFKVWCTYSNTTRDEQLFGADFKLYFRCSHFRCRCSCISFNFTSHVNSVQTNKCGNVVLAPTITPPNSLCLTWPLKSKLKLLITEIPTNLCGLSTLIGKLFQVKQFWSMYSASAT